MRKVDPQQVHIEILEDRIRRIRKIVDDCDESLPALMEIDEILREMDYDNY